VFALDFHPSAHNPREPAKEKATIDALKIFEAIEKSCADSGTRCSSRSDPFTFTIT
jgi:hypothetical protein